MRRRFRGLLITAPQQLREQLSRRKTIRGKACMRWLSEGQGALGSGRCTPSHRAEILRGMRVAESDARLATPRAPRTAAPPRAATPAAAVLALQRAAGNAATCGTLGLNRRCTLARMVINADPGDQGITRDAREMVNRPFGWDTPAGVPVAPAPPFRPHGEPRTWVTADLSQLQMTEPLIIVAHGSRLIHETRGLEFADLTPEALVERLIERGLQYRYHGAIYLAGCYTAAGGGEAYVERVAQLLKDAGYLHVRVKGTLGAVVTRPGGLDVAEALDRQREYLRFKVLHPIDYLRFKWARSEYEEQRQRLAGRPGALQQLEQAYRLRWGATEDLRAAAHARSPQNVRITPPTPVAWMHPGDVH